MGNILPRIRIDRTSYGEALGVSIQNRWFMLAWQTIGTFSTQPILIRNYAERCGSSVFMWRRLWFEWNLGRYYR